MGQGATIGDWFQAGLDSIFSPSPVPGVAYVSDVVAGETPSQMATNPIDQTLIGTYNAGSAAGDALDNIIPSKTSLITTAVFTVIILFLVLLVLGKVEAL